MFYVYWFGDLIVEVDVGCIIKGEWKRFGVLVRFLVIRIRDLFKLILDLKNKINKFFFGKRDYF